MSVHIDRLSDEQAEKLNALLNRLKRGEPVCLDNESRDELHDIHTTLMGGDR